jgi:hypothetical protein
MAGGFVPTPSSPFAFGCCSSDQRENGKRGLCCWNRALCSFFVLFAALPSAKFGSWARPLVGRGRPTRPLLSAPLFEQGESFASTLWSLAVPADSWGENLPLDGRGRPSSPKRFSPTKGKGKREEKRLRGPMEKEPTFGGLRGEEDFFSYKHKQ